MRNPRGGLMLEKTFFCKEKNAIDLNLNSEYHMILATNDFLVARLFMCRTYNKE